MTREEWEKTHKPTCNVYPCAMWRDVHWHLTTDEVKKALGSYGKGGMTGYMKKVTNA